jgi:hypothetical protein
MAGVDMMVLLVNVNFRRGIQSGMAERIKRRRAAAFAKGTFLFAGLLRRLVIGRVDYCA